MDAYEATRIVFSRIQSLDPENAPKIMGLLLLQDHGEKEMIRLAFGPETLVHSVVLKARKDLGLLPPPLSSAPSTPSSPSPTSPFLLPRQNSTTSSRLAGAGLHSPSSWAPPPVFSRNGSNGGVVVVDDFQNNPDNELVSPASSYGVNMPSSSSSSSPPNPFYGGDLIDEFQLQDQLSFLNDPTARSSPNSIHALQIGAKNGAVAVAGAGDLFYPDISAECRSPSSNGDGMLFPYAAGMNWGGHHRRSCSVTDLCLASEAGSGGFGWKPCLYFARGYCKNGSSCRFLHGLPDDAAAATAAAAAAAMSGSMMDAMVEQQCHELLMRSKSQRLGSASQLMASAAAFPYATSAPSPSSGKCMNFLQQHTESQRAVAAAAAALMLGGEEPHKFGRSRMERNDYAGMVNPGSRQIYLTFPADSTFREEDVSNYFSIYGPVQDVRIPYQQKRMFGFVTFVYPETVKLILAKGNPHFVCDARVLVKPYKEKGKVPDKKQQQQQQQADRGDFSGCTTPTGLDSRDPYDLQQLGARMLYNNSQEVLLRRKLEEQQQAAELQQAIELQGRRFMGLQLLDLKARNHLSSPTIPVTSLPPSPGPINIPGAAAAAPTTADGRSSGSSSPQEHLSSPEDKSGCSAAASATVIAQAGAAAAAVNTDAEQLTTHGFPVNAPGASDKEESAGDGRPNENGDFQESADHNLPDSPFASPTKCSFPGDAFSLVSEAEGAVVTSATPNHTTTTTSCINNNISANNNSHLMASSLLPPTSLDMASFKTCFFPIPRFSSGHGAVGM